jgi:hypothetical protein
MEQPGYVTIAGCRIYAWVYPGNPERLTLSLISEDGAEAVTEAVVQSAERVETELRPLAERIIDPPQDDANCICPKWYPEFWRIG